MMIFFLQSLLFDLTKIYIAAISKIKCDLIILFIANVIDSLLTGIRKLLIFFYPDSMLDLY